MWSRCQIVSIDLMASVRAQIGDVHRRLAGAWDVHRGIRGIRGLVRVFGPGRGRFAVPEATPRAAGQPTASRQPTLRTERCVLTPAVAGDLQRLHRLWTDPMVRRHLFDDEVLGTARAAEVLHQSLAHGAAGCGLWLVTSTNGTLVGCAGLHPVTTVARADPGLAGLLEPVVALDPAAWGRGYAAAALACLADYAFQTLGVSALAGVHDDANHASQRMLLGCGFVPRRVVDHEGALLHTYVLAPPDGAGGSLAVSAT